MAWKGLRLGLVSFALVLPACGPKNVSIHKSSSYPVEVHWGDGGQKDDEVDFDHPSLAKALSDTERLVGRRVDFAFDVTLMARPRAGFLEAMFDSQVGRIPLELAALQERDPEVFAFVAQGLQKVAFDYDGARVRREVSYDPKAGVLRYVLVGAGIGRGSVAYATSEAFGAAIDQRFAGRSLREIRPDELAEYTRWVDDHRRQGEDVLAPVTELLEVWTRVSKSRKADPEVLSILREAIPGRASNLASHYNDRASGRKSSPLLNQAGGMFGLFVDREFALLSEKGQADVLRSLFPKRSGLKGREADRYVRDAYPELDRLRFGLGLARQWLADGAPERVGEGKASKLLTDLICPRGHGDRPLDNSHCRGDGSLWHFASFDDASRQAVARAIVSINDPRLTLTALAGMRDANATGMVEVWHRLEKSPKHWTIGARVLGDRIIYDGDDKLTRSLYDEAVGSWKKRPQRRGGYLYILAANEYPASASDGLVPFDDFARVFGSRIDARTFRAYLEVSDGAWVRVPAVWPALAPGVGAGSVKRIALRLLDEGPAMYKASGLARIDVLSDWLRVMRKTRDTASASAARKVFRQRLREKPSEESAMRGYISLTEGW